MESTDPIVPIDSAFPGAMFGSTKQHLEMYFENLNSSFILI